MREIQTGPVQGRKLTTMKNQDFVSVSWEDEVIGTRHVKTGMICHEMLAQTIRMKANAKMMFKAKGTGTIELNHRLRKYKQKPKSCSASEEGLNTEDRERIEPEAIDK